MNEGETDQFIPAEVPEEARVEQQICGLILVLVAVLRLMQLERKEAETRGKMESLM